MGRSLNGHGSVFDWIQASIAGEVNFGGVERCLGVQRAQIGTSQLDFGGLCTGVLELYAWYQ